MDLETYVLAFVSPARLSSYASLHHINPHPFLIAPMCSQLLRSIHEFKNKFDNAQFYFHLNGLLFSLLSVVSCFVYGLFVLINGEKGNRFVKTVSINFVI